MKKNRFTARIALFLALALTAGLLGCLVQDQPQGGNEAAAEPIAASADGVQITVKEYRATFEMFAAYYTNASLSDEELRVFQESIARQVLLQKIYIKEAKERGITLTEEEQAACAQNAQEEIDGIEKTYRKQLEESGNFSNQALILILSQFYDGLGMNQDEYKDLLQLSEESELYRAKLEQYYVENVTPDEETLLRYYRESVEQSMYTTAEDGSQTSAYTPGMFWYYLKLYQTGSYTPMLYVPEGFIFIDYIELRCATTEEAEESVRKVLEGEVSFDELMQSEANQDPFRSGLQSPYAIGETDHGELFTPQSVYTKAAALEIGQIDAFVGQAVTDEDGNTTVTAYLVRRAEGTMCLNGESGVIDIDWYPGVREKALATYRGAEWSAWMSDVQYEDAVYAYKGSLG